jgi:hypothetical protein
MNGDAAPSADDSAFNDCFVLYFDFLGSSAAATAWPRERLYEFVDLLISIAQMQSALQIDGEPQADGSYRITLTPEITTFSDHIVISYPSLPAAVYGEFYTPALDHLWTGIVLKDTLRILSGVAELGLRIGLLIRGGFAFGQLFHGQGVVFGRAMVDAYLLESTVAKYPRVVVSDDIIEKVTRSHPENLGFFLSDTDGKSHLNYFASMVRGARQHSPDITLWRAAHIARIDREIERLRQDVANTATLHAAAKWEWFRRHFEAAASHGA